MCGFTGFTNHIDNSNAVLQEMLNRIKHRGPDAEGTYIDEDIALGHRRLSIIDVSDAGTQPLYSADGNLALLFNGEIYNYKTIRQTLIEKGYQFATQTDSEVLIYGYQEYGTALLQKLRGMFSFVIWNKKEKTLFGARDFFGIKPLYYAQMGETFLFGSEIKSFLPHPHFKKVLNTAALENYLTFQYSPCTETFFKGVYKLPPAHYFIYKNGKLDIQQYWEIEFHADEKPSLDDWVNQISDTFHNSVEAHKIADVEVGSFLSSGVDSSYVAAIADVDKTFTVGFGKEERYNEIGWAKGFSEAIGKKNYSKVIEPEEYWAHLPMIQYHMDEPLADPAAVALYFVCNLASQSLKVVLSGEGADEIFGGYNVYSDPGSTSYEKLPRGLRRGIMHIAESLPAHRGVNFFVRKGKDLEERFIGNAFMLNEAERERILKHPTGKYPHTALTKPFYDKAKDLDDVTKMQYIDIHFWLIGDILLKADKMSMANSLEVRVPFLDRVVFDVARKVPTEYKVNKENTKFAMRQAAHRYLPDMVAEKKKLGFPVPIRIWLREENYYNMVKEAFHSPAAEEFFKVDEIMKYLDEHKAGKADNSRKIWTIYMFLVWHKQFFG